MRIRACGYGAGSRIEPEPNLLRLTLGQATHWSGATDDTIEQLALLACNLDDMNPQWYGHLFELLLAPGALDVTPVPARM